jgi:hypothetical protein
VRTIRLIRTVRAALGCVIMSPPGEPRNALTADDRLRRIESVTDAELAHLNVEDLLRSIRRQRCCWTRLLTGNGVDAQARK